MRKAYNLLWVILGIVMITGCKTEEDYRKERAVNAVRYFHESKIRNRVLTEDVRLTLAQCIKIGLEHNLDLKVQKQEEDIAAEMRTAEFLGMLPEINLNNSFNARSNTPASSSKAYKADGATYEASQNQDKDINSFNIDFALSVMDFGLAFFNSQQAQDRVLLRRQRTERMKQNLTMDIINAYCRVAAAQRAQGITTGLINESKDYQKRLKGLVQSRKITPFRAFEATRKFAEMERRLKAYTLDYQNACAELRSLLGFYPSAMIEVDDTFLDTVPTLTLPKLEVMEQIALIKRPELTESDLKRHISIVEWRKTILSMFPNTRIFMDYNNVNNSFLYNQNWWDFGIQAAFNLLKLPQKIAVALAHDEQADAEKYRAYGQSIAVIAQVRIAQSDIYANKDNYVRAKKSYENYKRALVSAQRNVNIAAGGVPRIEIDHMRLTTAEANIEYALATADYYVSFYRLLNTMGIGEANLQKFNTLPAELKKAEKEAEIVIAGGK